MWPVCHLGNSLRYGFLYQYELVIVGYFCGYLSLIRVSCLQITSHQISFYII